MDVLRRVNSGEGHVSVLPIIFLPTSTSDLISTLKIVPSFVYQITHSFSDACGMTSHTGKRTYSIVPQQYLLRVILSYRLSEANSSILGHS